MTGFSKPPRYGSRHHSPNRFPGSTRQACWKDIKRIRSNLSECRISNNCSRFAIPSVSSTNPTTFHTGRARRNTNLCSNKHNRNETGNDRHHQSGRFHGPRVPGKTPPPTMGWGIRINLDTRKSMRATRSREMPRNEGSGPSGVRRNTPGGGSLRIPSIQPPPIPNPSQIWESGSPHFRSLPSQSGDFSAHGGRGTSHI